MTDTPDAASSYNTAQIAAFFDVTTYTVRKWIEKGRFPTAWKDPDTGGWRVPKVDVAELLAETYADDEPVVGI